MKLKRNIILSVVLMASAFSARFIPWQPSVMQTSVIESKADYKHTLTVIIDRAHGSNVAGKGSPDGRHKEWRWSNYWADELGKHLSEVGFKVVYTVSDSLEPGLKTRVEKMNQIAAPAVVLSLHNNAAGMGAKWTAARGFSVWTTKGLTRSDQCAEIVFRNFRSILPDLPFRADYTDKDADFEANFTVLLSRHPSILLEYLFQDNEADLSLIENYFLNRTIIDIITVSLIQIEKYLTNEKQISYEKNIPFGYGCGPCGLRRLQPSKAA